MSGWLIALLVMIVTAGMCAIYSKKIREACNARDHK